MKIGIDIMGGDFAPKATTLGAILANESLAADEQLVLIGDRNVIIDICKEQGYDHTKLEIVHSNSVIEMGDNPVKAFTSKTDSSINIGYQMLKDGELDGFASAGNTGAMLVGAMYTVKQIPGVIRPALAAAFPMENGNSKIMLDMGINSDCRPDVLYQYAIIGSLYSEHVYGINNPKIALLNIGEEEEKGNLLTKSTFPTMKGSKDFNFVGNVEGHDFFSPKCDVVVCDGFTGNVVLKQAEAFYEMMKHRNIHDEYFDKFNFENYGGSPILGVNKTAIIGHGVSNDKAIKSMIFLTRDIVKSNLTEKIKQAFNK